jgi:hypothetical protein
MVITGIIAAIYLSTVRTALPAKYIGEWWGIRDKDKYTSKDIFETCVTRLSFLKDGTGRYIENPESEEDANDIFAGGAQYDASIINYSSSSHVVYTKNNETGKKHILKNISIHNNILTFRMGGKLLTFYSTQDAAENAIVKKVSGFNNFNQYLNNYWEKLGAKKTTYTKFTKMKLLKNEYIIMYSNNLNKNMAGDALKYWSSHIKKIANATWYYLDGSSLSPRETTLLHNNPYFASRLSKKAYGRWASKQGEIWVLKTNSDGSYKAYDMYENFKY